MLKSSTARPTADSRIISRPDHSRKFKRPDRASEEGKGGCRDWLRTETGTVSESVDDQGKIIWGDQLMILFSRDILTDNQGATFVGEVKCSQNLFRDVEEHGGKAIMWRTGHSLIEEKIREEKAALGGR